MSKISSETIKQNTRLTDFEELKQAVIEHIRLVRRTPRFETKEESDQSLTFFM